MNSCVAVIQMNSTDNLAENLRQAELLIAQAAHAGAKLIVLPEMFVLIGKNETDKLKLVEAAGQGIIQTFLANQALTHKVWLVGGTVPIAAHDPYKVRAACFLYDAMGKPVARYDKIHMFDVLVGDHVYQESKTIEAGDRIIVVETSFGKLGLAVCYDIRFPEFAQHMVELGAEIIAVPTAFTRTTGQAHWEILIRSLAIQTQCYVLAACQTGQHANGRETFGNSMIIDPWGSVLACLPKGIGTLTAEIDLAYLKQIRDNMPLQQQRSKVEKGKVDLHG